MTIPGVVTSPAIHGRSFAADAAHPVFVMKGGIIYVGGK